MFFEAALPHRPTKRPRRGLWVERLTANNSEYVRIGCFNRKEGRRCGLKINLLVKGTRADG